MANERLQCPGETGCQWQPCLKGMRKNSETEKSQAPYCKGAGRKGTEGALAFSVCLELPLSRKASPSPSFSILDLEPPLPGEAGQANGEGDRRNAQKLLTRKRQKSFYLLTSLGCQPFPGSLFPPKGTIKYFFPPSHGHSYQREAVASQFSILICCLRQQS